MGMFNVFHIAGSALTAQSMRLNAVASNLANADSIVGPDGQPYRAKQVVFEAYKMSDAVGMAGQAVRVKQVVDSAAPPRMVYDPRNPAADANGNVMLPNVNPVEEMVNMISSSRSYQTNVEVMNTAKQLILKTLTVGQ